MKEVIDLSVVVTVVGGKDFLVRCLSRLTAQAEGRAIEIVVPYDATVEGIEEVRSRFPGVVFVDLGAVRTRGRPGTHTAAHELYDRRRARGLGAARGDIVAIVEDYDIPAPDWCDQVLEAHRVLGHGVIGGAVEHGGGGALNWAVYFLDFGRYQPPLAEGPAEYLTDVNVSYKRAALETVRHLWVEEYHEVTVHWALQRQGFVLWRRPQVVVAQDRGRLSLGAVLRERFAWGRLFGVLRAQEASRAVRLGYALAAPVIPLVLIARRLGKVLRDSRTLPEFLTSLPALTTLAVAWCLGEVVGCVTAR